MDLRGLLLEVNKDTKIGYNGREYVPVDAILPIVARKIGDKERAVIQGKLDEALWFIWEMHSSKDLLSCTDSPCFYCQHYNELKAELQVAVEREGK